MSEVRRHEYDHEGLSVTGALLPHHIAADSRFLEGWLPSGAENNKMKHFIIIMLLFRYFYCSIQYPLLCVTVRQIIQL